jgi:hypothetical protein
MTVILQFIIANLPIILLHLVAVAAALLLWPRQAAALVWVIYKFLWYTVLQRREPFTHQLARMVVAHGPLFWLPYVGVQFTLWQYFQPPWWLSFDWLLFNAWLMDHLNDYVRLNPENSPND